MYSSFHLLFELIANLRLSPSVFCENLEAHAMSKYLTSVVHETIDNTA